MKVLSSFIFYDACMSHSILTLIFQSDLQEKYNKIQNTKKIIMYFEKYYGRKFCTIFGIFLFVLTS